MLNMIQALIMGGLLIVVVGVYLLRSPRKRKSSSDSPGSPSWGSGDCDSFGDSGGDGGGD